MTMGSVTLDGRYAVDDPIFGKSKIGRYLDRNWSGGDRPPKTRLETKVLTLRRWHPSKVYFNRKTGAYRVSRKLVVSSVVKTYRVRNRLTAAQIEAPHPYSMSRNEWNNPLIFVKQTGIANAPIYQGGFREIWSEPTGSGWSSNDDLALLGRLREAVAGSSFNAGVFLGEMTESLDMIRDSALKIGASIRAARKGNFKKAFQLVTGSVPPRRDVRSRSHTKDVVANNWLELQYGWLPLMSDAADAAAFLATALNGPLTFKARASYKRSSPLTNMGPVLYGGQKCYARGQYIAYLREKNYPELSGLVSPSSIVWELVPYSFVIDWFAPIGAYLDARSLIGSLTGTFVNYTKYVLEVSGASIKPGYWTYAGGDLSSVQLSRVQFSRAVSTSLSVPTPELKSLKSVASWRHCANALALLSQLRPSRVSL